MLTFLVAAALAAGPPAVADTDSTDRAASTLSGVVTDTTGAPLELVRVTVLEAERTVLTNPDGRYLIEDLPTGTYAISFALVGYAPQVHHITLTEGDVTLDVQLRATL